MVRLAKKSLSLFLSLMMILGMMAAIQMPALAADDVDATPAADYIDTASPANTINAAPAAIQTTALAANNAGGVLGSFGPESFPTGGGYTIGDDTWTNYVVETAITLDTELGVWPGGKIILRKYNDGPTFYFIELQKSGTISLKKAPDYDNAIEGKYMPIPGTGGDAVGKKIYYRVTVEGYNFKVETSLTGFDDMTTTLEVTDDNGDLPTGGAGVDFYNIAAEVESFTVREIGGTPPVNPPAGPTLLNGVSISGVAQVGETLTAVIDPSDATATYEWFSDSTPVGTGGSYVVAQTDIGKTIMVVATGTGNFSGSATSDPTAAVVAATGLPVLAVTLDMNIDTITDGKIKVSSVATPTGSSLYYALGGEQAKPAAGTNISAVGGAAELTLNTEIGTNVNRTYFINVYDVAANGEIVGFGKLPIPYNGIGTILIAETNFGDLSRGAVRTMGSEVWKNYIIEADIVVSSNNPGGAAGYGGVQLFFRHIGNDNTAGTTLFGAVTFDKTVALQCSPYVDANCAYAGKLDLDIPIHMKITADGNDFKVEATPSDGGATQTASKTLNSFSSGKVGFRLENVDGSINNYTVRRIRKPDDPATGDSKTKITGAVVYPIRNPVAGNYPNSLYQFPNQGNSATPNDFEQTITWAPEIPKVFATNTEYTATLRLHPRSATQTFNGVALADIIGLPTTGVSDTTVEYDGDDMLIHIAFNATGSVNTAPEVLFRDDFDGASLDTSKWALCPQDTRQGRSTWRDEMVSVGGGNLHLGIEKNSQYAPAGTSQALLDNWIKAGAVRTRAQSGDPILFENGYGYYEARMKLPKISGTWGAFWLMSPTEELVGNDGVDGTEIDIIETIDNHSNGFNAALHWDGYGADHKMDNSGVKTLETCGIDIYDGEFHTFAVDWSPTEYVFYVDDVVFWRTDAQPQGIKPGINQNPNYIKLTAEGSDIAGPLPAGFTNGEVLVDYVYVLNQPKKIDVTEDADSYANVTMAPSFDAARDVWLVEATVKNTTANAYFKGTVAVENSSGIVKTATQEFDIIAPGATRKVYFEVNPFYNFTSAADEIAYSYTLSNNRRGSGTYRFGTAAALKTNGAIAIDGNASEAVWQTAPVIDFAKATPPATVTAKLAWDSANLYVTAAVIDTNHVQTASNGEIINGDSVQVLVGGKNLAFALNGANVIAYDLTANTAATAIKAAIVTAGGTTKYEIAIPWSYLGINGGSLSHGSLLDVALIVNDTDGVGRTVSSYFTEANMGALVLTEHVVIPKHVVSFNSNGGSSVPFADVADNGKLTAPTTPTRPGYDFDGWFKDAALTLPWDFVNDTVTGDITLYARWKQYYTVFFEPLGGTAVSPIKTYGAAISPPPPPTRDGYTFGGWYTTEALTTSYNFSSAVTSNVTLYAKWTLAGGKVDAATLVTLQLSWHYDAANFKKVISATLTNNDSAAQSGTVKITAPIGITQGTVQTYSLSAGASTVLNFDIADGYTPQRDIETVIADYTAGDAGVGSTSVKVGFVEAELVPTAPVIDGDLNDSAWQTGNIIDLGAGSSSLGNPARNYMDTSGTAKLRWDENYLYVALDIQTDSHNMSASQASGIWDYDSVQMLLKNSSGNYKEVGFALDAGANKILAYSWADTINGASGVGEISASNATAAIVRNNTSKTTTYEIALKWDYMLGSSRGDMKIGDILEVCLLLNDRNATGRRYISYFDGIAATKGVGVGKLLLSAQQTLTPVDPPAPPPPGPTTPSTSNQSASSTPQYLPASVVSPLNNKSSDTLNNALKAAEKAGGESLSLMFKNISNFTKDNAAAIIKRAKELGKTASVSSDTMSSDNKYVEVRVTVNPELIKQTVKLDGYVRSSQVEITESKFKRFFENKTAVIRLGQEGAFGQTAKIAAKIDLAGFETKNLYFYVYDKKTNSYSRILNPAHWVDKNGYLHFETALGGDIIISNGPLMKK